MIRPRSLAGRVGQLLVGPVVSPTGIWLATRAELGEAPWEGPPHGAGRPPGRGRGHDVGRGRRVLVALAARAGVGPGSGLFNMLTIGFVLDVLLAAPMLRQVADAGPVWRMLVLVSGIVVFASRCATLRPTAVVRA